MKKFLKIIIICLILIFLIIVSNTIRNFLLITELKENASKYLSNITSYKISTQINAGYTTEFSKEMQYTQTTQEIYYKDNKYLIKHNINNDNSSVKLIDRDTEIKENKNFMDYLEELTVDGLKIQYFDNSIIKLYLFSFIIKENKYYIICSLNNYKFYYNKESGIISKVTEKNNSIFQEYLVEKNVVTDEDMKIPNN